MLVCLCAEREGWRKQKGETGAEANTGRERERRGNGEKNLQEMDAIHKHEI